MNAPQITLEQAWQMTVDQLRLDMPAASFDTWVSSTHFVTFDDGVFTRLRQEFTQPGSGSKGGERSGAFAQMAGQEATSRLATCSG